MFRSIELNSVRYNLKDNIEDYTEQEKVAIKNCFSNLEVKAQGAELSIEETALRVAWHRLLREENFFVVQAKPKKVAAAKTGRKTKAVTELSPEEYLASLDTIGQEPAPKTAVKAAAKPKATAKPKAPSKRAKKAVKELSLETIARHRAQELAFRKNRGEELTQEEEAFLQEELRKLEELLNE